MKQTRRQGSISDVDPLGQDNSNLLKSLLSYDNDVFEALRRWLHFISIHDNCSILVSA